MDNDLYKFGHLVGECAEPYAYPNVWTVEHTASEDRLVIAPAAGYVGLLIDLIRDLPEPLAFLYVSLVPRTARAVGRYEGPLVDRRSAEAFLLTFTQLFEDDGGHHVWVASIGKDPAGEPAGQIVYDQHNLIYAYGPIAAYESVLIRHGLARTTTVSIPSQHVHRYNPEIAGDYEALFDYWEWLQTPLLAEDEE